MQRRGPALTISIGTAMLPLPPPGTPQPEDCLGCNLAKGCECAGCCSLAKLPADLHDSCTVSKLRAARGVDRGLSSVSIAHRWLGAKSITAGAAPLASNTPLGRFLPTTATATSDSSTFMTLVHERSCERVSVAGDLAIVCSVDEELPALAIVSSVEEELAAALQDEVIELAKDSRGALGVLSRRNKVLMLLLLKPNVTGMIAALQMLPLLSCGLTLLYCEALLSPVPAHTASVGEAKAEILTIGAARLSSFWLLLRLLPGHITDDGSSRTMLAAGEHVCC